MQHANVKIGILIGGLSRRMGRPKALIEIDGRTILERTVGVARQAGHPVILLGQPTFELPATLSHVPVLPDLAGGFGPIAGLESILEASPNTPVLLLACDMPRLEASLLERLLHESAHEADAVAFSIEGTGGRLEPCCALYMPTALSEVRRGIQNKDYSLHSLFARIRTRQVHISLALGELLVNCNVPEDLPDGKTEAQRDEA